MNIYTDKEKNILSQYFTNIDTDTFCLINLPEVIKGTLFSRYSRTAKDLRRLFLDEFVRSDELRNFFKNKKQTNEISSLNIKKAEDFYERILLGYGDDSVAELGGAHIALENISVLATKSIEEHRIGLSPLEKSSRYVYFDKQVGGKYQYYIPKKIIESKHKDLYIRTTERLFQTYSKIVHELQPVLEKVYPGDKTDTAYRFSIRAKACDLTRGLLPLSVKTNMGIFANGRSYEYMILTLLNDPLQETRLIAREMHKNLSQVIGAFIKRAINERGDTYRDYLTKRDYSFLYLRKMNTKQTVIKDSIVKLLEYDKKAEEKIIAFILFETTNLRYKEAYYQASQMFKIKKEELLKKYCVGRRNRHQKLGRALENAYVAFEITADWGVYKDLMRHRILTRQRQLFTNELGYWISEEIKYSRFRNDYNNAMTTAMNAYSIIKKDFPVEAQYLVVHGAYNRFYLKMNLRELVYLTELRSIPQGHPTYRRVAQIMTKLVLKKYPLLGKYIFTFVDYKDYGLERLSAFKKIEEKANKMGIAAFKD
jgi:thymidylate synthase ThyX